MKKARDYQARVNIEYKDIGARHTFKPDLKYIYKIIYVREKSLGENKYV